MSLEAIQKAYKEFQNDETILFYTDEETVDIINAIANYILKDYKAPEAVPITDRLYISLREGFLSSEKCAEKIGLIAANTLRTYCKKPEFAEQCARLHYKKWYIHPEKAKEYLMQYCTIFRNRVNRIDSMKK